jgi:hypothetical protein
VQFCPQPPAAVLQYAGRAEHLVSGQVAHFEPLEELLAFMSRVLADVKEQWVLS